MRSHTWVVEEWHVESLQALAEKGKHSQSWVLRSILDRVLPSLIMPSDIESLFIRRTDESTEEGTMPMP